MKKPKNSATNDDNVVAEDQQGVEQAPEKTAEEIEQERIQQEREFFMQMHRASGIQVGDKVILAMKVPDRHLGWDRDWQQELDDLVGKKVEVTGDDNDNDGFAIDHPETGYAYWVPSFALRRIIPIKEGHLIKRITDGYNAEVYKDAAHIGCNRAPWSKVKELYEAGVELGYIKE